MMTSRPEILVQLARLLSDQELRDASDEAVQAAVNQKFWALVEGLMAEAAVSDDVNDRDSARQYLEARVDFLSPVLKPDQCDLLRETLARGVEAW
jgi:hypothetical protein